MPVFTLLATSRFDNFTQADYEEYTSRQHDHDVNDDCRPAAFFRLMKGSQLRTEVELNHRFVERVCVLLFPVKLKLCVMDLNTYSLCPSFNLNIFQFTIIPRSGKYVLIKLLRAEGETDNIDIQYIGFIGMCRILIICASLSFLGHLPFLGISTLNTDNIAISHLVFSHRIYGRSKLCSWNALLSGYSVLGNSANSRDGCEEGCFIKGYHNF